MHVEFICETDATGLFMFVLCMCVLACLVWGWFHHNQQVGKRRAEKQLHADINYQKSVRTWEKDERHKAKKAWHHQEKKKKKEEEADKKDAKKKRKDRWGNEYDQGSMDHGGGGWGGHGGHSVVPAGPPQGKKGKGKTTKGGGHPKAKAKGGHGGHKPVVVSKGAGRLEAHWAKKK